MVEHGEAEVELQICFSPRKLCASYRHELGIKNLHTQFECKELWGRQLDVEYKAFKEGGGGKERKILDIYGGWRLGLSELCFN